MLPAEDPIERAPVWLITYSDLMTLLLVFFVLLFSISEFRETERFQGVATSLHQKFGKAAGDDDPALAAHMAFARRMRDSLERRQRMVAEDR